MNVFSDLLLSDYQSGYSIAEACRRNGVHPSTGRRKIIAANIARGSRASTNAISEMFTAGESIKSIAATIGFTAQTVINHLRQAGIFVPHRDAIGIRVSSNGYVEYTRGAHSGRSVHVVAMEERIGRGLMVDEVVHHIDGDKLNNDEGNLVLMTRSAHTRLHRQEDQLSGNERQRNTLGRLV